MSEIKEKTEPTIEVEEDFAHILNEERKHLRTLNKEINKILWKIEKERELEQDDDRKVQHLKKELTRDLYSYDMIVKRLIDLKQRAPEAEEDDDSGYRKEITSLINWAKEGSDKHQLILFKVDNSIDNKTQQQEKHLLRDLPGAGCRSTKHSKARRQHNNHLVRC